MVISNHKRIGLALELLKMGVAPYIGREIKGAIKKGHISRHIIHDYVEDPGLLKIEISQWELKPLLKLMDDTWNVIFQNTLGFSEHSILGELREWLARWDDQANISNDDTDRIMDSVVRFLNAIGTTDVAADAERMKKEFRKFIYEEQVRAEEQPEAEGEDQERDLVETSGTETLKPWRDIITPRPEVTNGRYLEAEFAADLWQVHQGEATDEYRDPAEFFRRTHLTESIRKLIVSSIQRISGMDGDPVVLLESGFGGGKTHSMLALYHLFSGVNTSELPGVEPLTKEADVYSLPIVKRAVLVGNKISPSSPSVKPNGLTIRTLWGELAYQLGGKKAFEKIREFDKKGNSPGEKKLRDLLASCGPCLVLVDEWVAYVRQLYDQKDLAGGTCESQFVFVKDLLSAAKQTRNCLVVISLPVITETGSEISVADDSEVGGTNGKKALNRLREEIGKAETSWQPATPVEDLEIVRYRLFEPVAAERDKFIKMTAMAFTELYIQKRLEFPSETQTSNYKRRMQLAYPIHPEVFDRLYQDWASLILFQRTRGVLRLMATVIHTLWEKGDRNPIILPSTIPLNDSRVQSEITRYLPDQWADVLTGDVDGPEAASHKIDTMYDHLGRVQAARRVARTIYFGSSPCVDDAQQGIDELRVVLGCVMPGESPAIFHDALQHLASGSTYLNKEDGQFWYATSPSVSRMAQDRAEALNEDLETVSGELQQRLLSQMGTNPDFAEVHMAEGPSEIIPDDPYCRLVVLPVDQPFGSDTDNPAVYTANSILESCGDTPRTCRNAPVFLAADESGVADLDEAVRFFLAWDSIHKDKKKLKLGKEQVQQAEIQLKSSEDRVNKRIHATYKWLLVPTQAEPGKEVSWKAIGLDRADTLADAAALTLRDKMLMLPVLDATTLRMYLDELSVWDEDHVPLQKLIGDVASQNYLPRLAGPHVLLEAVREGLALSTWEDDGFAYADRFEKESGLFEGLTAGESVDITETSDGLLVRAERAAAQLNPDEAAGLADEEEPYVESEELAAEADELVAAGEESPAEVKEDPVTSEALLNGSEEDAAADEEPLAEMMEEPDNIEAQLDASEEVDEPEFSAEAEAEGKSESVETEALEKDAVADSGDTSDKDEQEEISLQSGTSQNNGIHADKNVEANGGEHPHENGVHANGNGVSVNGNGLSANGNGKPATGNGTPVNGNGIHAHGNGATPPNFHQRVTLDPEQAAYDAGLITELLIQHLSEKAGVELSVTLEVNARLPDGMEEQLARIMIECVRPRKAPKLELVNG